MKWVLLICHCKPVNNYYLTGCDLQEWICDAYVPFDKERNQKWKLRLFSGNVHLKSVVLCVALRYCSSINCMSQGMATWHIEILWFVNV